MPETSEMTEAGTSSRRAFLKGGAIVAAPLAVAIPGAAIAADEREARLRRLEDEAAIRALHQDWLRRVNARTAADALFVDASAAQCLDAAVCAIAPDHAAEAERIEIAEDGKRATGRFTCLIETETRLLPENTFAQMALAQGGGITRTSERREVRANYVKLGQSWAIATIETRAV
ncbi:MAG: hypothetical protein J0G94_09740 [Sphingomonadales bacterium]|nr:hypothetical protein [Sphingomonadales bacterium]